MKMVSRNQLAPKNQEEGGIRGEHGSLPEIAPPTGGFMTSAEVIAIWGITLAELIEGAFK